MKTATIREAQHHLSKLVDEVNARAGMLDAEALLTSGNNLTNSTGLR